MMLKFNVDELAVEEFPNLTLVIFKEGCTVELHCNLVSYFMIDLKEFLLTSKDVHSDDYNITSEGDLVKINDTIILGDHIFVTRDTCQRLLTMYDLLGPVRDGYL